MRLLAAGAAAVDEELELEEERDETLELSDEDTELLETLLDLAGAGAGGLGGAGAGAGGAGASWLTIGSSFEGSLL